MIGVRLRMWKPFLDCLDIPPSFQTPFIYARRQVLAMENQVLLGSQSMLSRRPLCEVLAYVCRPVSTELNLCLFVRISLGFKHKKLIGIGQKGNVP